MISKTIGFRGTQHFQTHPFVHSRSICFRSKSAIKIALLIAALQAGLALLIEQVGSVEAAGEAIYSTLFEAAPRCSARFFELEVEDLGKGSHFFHMFGRNVVEDVRYSKGYEDYEGSGVSTPP